MRLAAKLLFVSILFTLPCCAVDWPMYHFKPTHSGLNPGEKTIDHNNVKFLAQQWVGVMGNTVDFSSPAIVGTSVYIGSTDGLLYVFDARGCGSDACNALWTGNVGGEIFSSPAVSGGFVYIGSNNHTLAAFSANGCGQSSCQPLWTGTVGNGILQSSPVVSKGLVFVGSYDNNLYAFAAKGCGKSTCSPVWMGKTGDHITSSPAVAKGVVYVGSNDGNLYAFTAAGCGASVCLPLWIGPTGSQIFESSPTIAGGRCLRRRMVSISASRRMETVRRFFDALGVQSVSPTAAAAAMGAGISNSPIVRVEGSP